MSAVSRTISPASPSRSLESCYGIASRIYDKYGHTEFGDPEIAGAAKLSATGGVAKSLVSDLKQYGLIEKRTSGRFAISQKFKDFMAMTPGTPEFKVAAYQFTRNPSIFQRVLDEAKGKLPEEAALASNLRSTRKFNQDKAKTTARALSESLEWIGILDSKRNILEPRSSRTESLKQTVDEAEEDIPSDAEDSLPLRPGERLLSLDIALANARIAHVKYPHDLTVDEARKIGNVLAAICE
jgi:hypothetical protein